MSDTHPCAYGCELKEYRGLRDCRETGQCQNQSAPLSSGDSTPAASNRSEPEPGRGAGLLLMLAITLASFLMGD